MDLLASVLAYFSTVTAIIVSVVMSYDAFVYTPLHSTIPQHTPALAAKPSAAKTAAKPTFKIARLGSPVAEPVRRGAAGDRTAPQADAAAKRRAARVRNAMVQQGRTRRLARQAWATEWAYQQAPVGYADDPGNRFGYDRFQ